jgi:hypothetical protein
MSAYAAANNGGALSAFGQNAAGIGGGMLNSYVQGAIGDHFAAKQMNRQRRLSEYNLKMGPSFAVEGLKAAGLNPILAFRGNALSGGAGGIGGGSGASVGPVTSPGLSGSPGQRRLTQQLTAAQTRNTEAQTVAALEQAGKTRAEKSRISMQTLWDWVDTAQTISQQRLNEQRTRREGAAADVESNEWVKDARIMNAVLGPVLGNTLGRFGNLGLTSAKVGMRLAAPHLPRLFKLNTQAAKRVGGRTRHARVTKKKNSTSHRSAKAQRARGTRARKGDGNLGKLDPSLRNKSRKREQKLDAIVDSIWGK